MAEVAFTYDKDRLHFFPSATSLLLYVNKEFDTQLRKSFPNTNLEILESAIEQNKMVAAYGKSPKTSLIGIIGTPAKADENDRFLLKKLQPSVKQDSTHYLSNAISLKNNPKGGAQLEIHLAYGLDDAKNYEKMCVLTRNAEIRFLELADFLGRYIDERIKRAEGARQAELEISELVLNEKVRRYEDLAQGRYKDALELKQAEREIAGLVLHENVGRYRDFVQLRDRAREENANVPEEKSNLAILNQLLYREDERSQ